MRQIADRRRTESPEPAFLATGGRKQFEISRDEIVSMR
jgi:hypothetical protein